MNLDHWSHEAVAGGTTNVWQDCKGIYTDKEFEFMGAASHLKHDEQLMFKLGYSPHKEVKAKI